MSAHAEALTDRLPTLYRDGDLVRGLAKVLGLQLEIADEEARIIQRAHWFDTTAQLAEAAALGALLDIDPEPWQSLGEFRAWLHALRTARLDHGAVTGPALRVFVEMYAEAFESANNVEALPAFEDEWPIGPVRAGHAFVENPPQTNGIRLGGPGAAEPLTQQAVVNGALDAAYVSILLTGDNGGEHVPVITNLTTGDALVYLDQLTIGDRLWVRANDDGSVTAELGRVDVTSKFRNVRRLTPGVPWSVADTETDVRALQLQPGRNDIWFLPVAHYGVAGLDRVLLALADLDLREGRWDKSTFDHALFYQDPGVLIDLVWTERLAASIRVDLDAGTLRCPAGQLEQALEAREQLESSLGVGIRKLTAAGVASTVRFRPLHESQRQVDHLVFISGMKQHDVGTIGIDHLRDAGGLFGVTDFDSSTYQ